MPGPTQFRRAAILGTGLIGGSFGLALHRSDPTITIAGWDKPAVLDRALELGAITKASSSLDDAISDADLVYVALPISVTLESLPAIAAAAKSGALITDACSTKSVICNLAAKIFSNGAKFLGGHPVAGKEISGINRATPDLFCGAHYALITTPEDDDPRVTEFMALIRRLGAEPLLCDAETHDWAAGIVSHLPQLVAVALARVVNDETDETGLPASLAGNGLRDTVRLAGSPYAVWRDICLTNSENITRALDRMSQAIDYLRSNLKNRQLEDEFASANALYKTLRSKHE
jgi:prephenate dehydrogenase